MSLIENSTLSNARIDLDHKNCKNYVLDHCVWSRSGRGLVAIEDCAFVLPQ